MPPVAARCCVLGETGLLVMDSMPNIGWLQAWIEIIDTIGPLFPAPPET